MFVSEPELSRSSATSILNSCVSNGQQESFLGAKTDKEMELIAKQLESL